MRCDELKDLVPLHLTGLLEGEEAARLQEHLEGGCPSCAAEVAATAAILGELPYALPAEEPSPMVKARLMARVRKESRESPSRAALWTRAAAAVVAAVLTGFVAGRRNAATLADLRGQVALQR